MNLIECSESCKFQADGYCRLEKCGEVSSVESGCPYFAAVSADNGNGLRKASDADKL